MTTGAEYTERPLFATVFVLPEPPNMLVADGCRAHSREAGCELARWGNYGVLFKTCSFIAL